jgi:hypothetical protein
VHEQEFRQPELITERIEPGVMLGEQDALRPLHRGARGRVEIRESEIVDRRDVVVAEHGRARALAHDRYALVGIGAVPDDVAQAHDFVGRRGERERRLQ